MILHLSEAAFLSILLSSIEAYKKETYGLILGYTTDTQWRVEYAVAYQTAERGHKQVVPHGGRDRRVRTCLAALTNYEQLGTFHSHPAWGNCRALARPSLLDANSLDEGELDLIVAVNDAHRRRRFHYVEEGRALEGTVCDFSIKIAGFYKPPLGDTRVRRVPIRCPHAIGFESELMLK